MNVYPHGAKVMRKTTHVVGVVLRTNTQDLCVKWETGKTEFFTSTALDAMVMVLSADSWEQTNDALRAVSKLFVYLHNTKPPKDSPEETIWERELVEVRKWANKIHDRRIKINMGLT